MPDSEGKLVVALLAVPESTASTLYGMYEILESAGRDWHLIEGRPGESVLHPRIVSATGRSFRARNGLMIEPHGAFADLRMRRRRSTDTACSLPRAPIGRGSCPAAALPAIDPRPRPRSGSGP